MEEMIQLPRSTYHRLLDHLALHAVTDSWAAELSRELELEAKPVTRLPNGSYLLDAQRQGKYQVSNE